MSVKIQDKRTEEEIEKYRQERIDQFLWLMKNINDVMKSMEIVDDPEGLHIILLSKLQKELREFMEY